MPRNTPLLKVLHLLKAELGQNLLPGVAPAQDMELNTLIEKRQELLYGEFDWPFMRDKQDVTVTAGTQYAILPTGINFDRPVKVHTLYNTLWYPVEYGIDEGEYNVLSSGEGSVTVAPLDPISKWDYEPGDPTNFEVWPIPATQQIVRFRGMRSLTSLRDPNMSGPGAPEIAFDYTATLDLDDMLIVLFVAAEKLQKAKPDDARLKYEAATTRLTKLKAVAPADKSQVVLGHGILNQQVRRYKKIRTT